MELVRITDKEKANFNAFVSASRYGSILQSFEWGDVKSGTWKPIRVALMKGTEIRATAVLLKRALPFKSILYAPRGPVLDFRNTQLVGTVSEQIKSLAAAENCVVLKCDPEIEETANGEIDGLKQNGFIFSQDNIQPRATILLDIREEPDALLKSFHHKTRYNIRLAEKKGVIVREENSRTGIDHYYSLFKTTSERNRFLILKKEYFVRLWETLSPPGYCTVFTAFFEDQPLASILVTQFGKRMTYLYGASSNQHRNLMPNHLLHWKAILRAREQGMETYDFWGIPGNVTRNHPLYGVYRFKKGFQETETRWIGTCELVFNKLFYSVLTRGINLAKSGVRLIKTGRIKGSLHE